MPVILDCLRKGPRKVFKKAEIRSFSEPIVLRNLDRREQALSWALTYLVRGGFLYRPSRGHYCILPKGLAPFTIDDGKRLTDENEGRH